MDKSLVWQRMGGRPQLLLKIIQQFLDFYPAQVQKIEEAVAAGDSQNLHRASHRLRGAVANFEVPAVVELLSSLEASGKSSEWVGVDGRLEQLRRELGQLHHELQSLSSEVVAGSA